jgi:hypothetical protein
MLNRSHYPQGELAVHCSCPSKRYVLDSLDKRHTQLVQQVAEQVLEFSPFVPVPGSFQVSLHICKLGLQRALRVLRLDLHSFKWVFMRYGRERAINLPQTRQASFRGSPWWITASRSCRLCSCRRPNVAPHPKVHSNLVSDIILNKIPALAMNRDDN